MSELNAGKGGEMQTAGECPFHWNVSGQRATELCHFLLLKKGMHHTHRKSQEVLTLDVEQFLLQFCDDPCLSMFSMGSVVTVYN